MTDDVDRYTRPGHDRDAASAILSQARLSQRGGHSIPLDDIQVLHLLRIGYAAGWAAAEKAIPEPTVEHGIEMSGGGLQIRPTDPQTEADWPLADWIRSKRRHGGRVHRRTIVVVEDWDQVPR